MLSGKDKPNSVLLQKFESVPNKLLEEGEVKKRQEISSCL